MKKLQFIELRSNETNMNHLLVPVSNIAFVQDDNDGATTIHFKHGGVKQIAVMETFNDLKNLIGNGKPEMEPPNK